jgi:hypothetical protein
MTSRIVRKHQRRSLRRRIIDGAVAVGAANTVSRARRNAGLAGRFTGSIRWLREGCRRARPDGRRGTRPLGSRPLGRCSPALGWGRGQRAVGAGHQGLAKRRLGARPTRARRRSGVCARLAQRGVGAEPARPLSAAIEGRANAGCLSAASERDWLSAGLMPDQRGRGSELG